MTDKIKSYIFPLIIVGIGIFTSFYIFLQARELGHLKRMEAFELEAKTHIFSLEEKLLASIEVLTAMKAFVENQDQMDFAKFQKFSASLMARHAELQAIAWIPRVANNERAQYEQAMSRYGYTDFSFTRRTENGLVSADEKGEYFPVYYIYPLEGNKPAHGFDLSSNKARAETFNLARDSAEIAMTPRLTLVQEKGSQAGTLVFMPLYENHTSPGSVEERQQMHIGFVDIVIRMGDLVEKSLRGLPDNIEISLEDMTSSETLYNNRLTADATSEISYYENISFGQRTLKITLHPKAGNFKNENITWSWLLLAGGTIVSCLSTLLVLQLSRSHQRVTEQVDEKTRELQASEERFSLAATGASVGIWDWIDVNSEEEYWSPQFYKLLGYEDGEIPSTLESFGAALHPEDTERTFALVDAAFKKEEVFELEYRLKTKSGAYRWFLGTAQVSFDVNDVPLRMVGSIQDIHERKTAEIAIKTYSEELQRSNADLEQFAYVASHDLKAPLRGIHNLAEWIEENIQDKMDDETKGYMNLLKGRIKRLEGLLSGLLQYSRASQHNTKSEKIDLNDMVSEIVDLNVTSNSNFTVNYDLPVVTAQRAVLDLIFRNLIGNAVKHHDAEQGIIHVSHEVSATEHIFTVEDDGPGVPVEFFDKVFKIFQTLRPRDEVEGSGMGLAIVKKLVERCGGKVWLEPANGLRGLCVKFSLPIKQ